MTPKRHLYKARWAVPGKPCAASVDFYANTNANARREADRIARRLGVTQTPRTLARGSTLIEVLSKGVSS